MSITETNEALPNIIEERIKILLLQTSEIEEKLKFLEIEKFFYNIGMPRKCDKETISLEEAKCLELVQNILKELKFLKYCIKFDMSASIN